MRRKHIKGEIIRQVYINNIEFWGILTCCLCFKPIKQGEESLEHLTPLSRGGSDDLYNLGIAHRKCNHTKVNKTLDEWFEIQDLRDV